MRVSLSFASLSFLAVASASTCAAARTTSTRTHKLTTTSKFTTTSKSTSTRSTAAPAPTATGDWFQPKTGASLLWSLDEPIPANPVSDTGLVLKGDLYDVDLFDATKAEIKAYHAVGKKVVCYFSAGTFENGRPDSKNFTSSCYCNKQSKCKMTDWDEWWLDLHTPACVNNIQTVMDARIALAKDKGCDAVEADNEDAYDNKTGWSISSIGLKNSPRMIAERPFIVNSTDFVIIEECAAYNECKAYQPFVDAGKAVWQVEYERAIKCTMPGFFVTAYSSYQVDYRNINAVCSKY